MATSNTCAFPVNSLCQRPTFNHVKASLSSSIKQSMKESPHIPNLDKSYVSEMVKKTSTKLLNAFVDLAFQFADQEAIPSQSNFAPVEEIGGRVAVVPVEGKIPHNFPEGVYIRNGISLAL